MLLQPDLDNKFALKTILQHLHTLLSIITYLEKNTPFPYNASIMPSSLKCLAKIKLSTNYNLHYVAYNVQGSSEFQRKVRQDGNSIISCIYIYNTYSQGCQTSVIIIHTCGIISASVEDSSIDSSICQVEYNLDYTLYNILDKNLMFISNFYTIK